MHRVLDLGPALADPANVLATRTGFDHASRRSCLRHKSFRVAQFFDSPAQPVGSFSTADISYIRATSFSGRRAYAYRSEDPFHGFIASVPFTVCARPRHTPSA